jgi:phage shock protein B
MDSLVPILIVAMLFIGMPWVILHYVTKWKASASMTGEDEALLDQLHDTARRLEERLATIERIVAADNSDFRPSRPAAVLRGADDHSLDRRN